MTAQEHANAIWRAEPSPEALAGAISAYTDELRGEIHRLKADHAAEVEGLHEVERILSQIVAACGKAAGARENCDPPEIIRTIRTLTAENAALKEEVQCNKDERADLVKLLDCHPAFLRHEIIRMQDQVRELPSIDRHREIQSDLTTARARIAELEGVIQSAVPVMEHILSIFDHPTRGVNYLDRDKFAAALAALSTQAPSK